jgi:hypothetical protein
VFLILSFSFPAMLGTQESPGVMVLTLKRLFEEVEEDVDTVTKVTLSYLEVSDTFNLLFGCSVTLTLL